MQRKIAGIAFTIVCAFACALGVTACTERQSIDSQTHQHDYAVKHDESQHWLQCDGAGCDIPQKEKEHHTYGDWEIVAAATEQGKGVKKHACTVCGFEEMKELPPLSHVHQMEHTAARSATCTQNGNLEYWYCDGCETYFADRDGETEITLAQTELNASGHSFTETAETQYLKSAADCTHKAVYYKSCSVCGAQSTETFEFGKENGHTFVEKAEMQYLSASADCTHKAVYYKSCSVCGVRSAETFEFGEAKGHTFTEVAEEAYLKSAADCTHRAVYFKSCAVCREKGTATFEYGAAKGHNFTANAEEAYLKSAADCTHKAVYYKSCPDCREKSIETFEYGEPTGHTFTETVEPQYLKSAADCTHKAVYFQSCSVCHEPSTATFEYGEPTGHTFTESAESQYLKSAADCTHKAVYFQSCSVCGVRSTATFEFGELGAHVYSQDWGKDGVQHWHACSVCGNKSAVEDHDFSKGDCICGADAVYRLLSVEGATVDGTNISMLVDKNTDYVPLSGKVELTAGRWDLYSDLLGQHKISTKIAAGADGKLANGNNTFYLVHEDAEGELVAMYTLTVYRSFPVSVNYYGVYDSVIHTETADTGYVYAAEYLPEITGYTFRGWKNANGNTVTSFTPDAPIDLYADCTANEYTFTLDANGGEGSRPSQVVAFDSDYILPAPTRTGHTFLGWFHGDTKVTDEEGSGLSQSKFASDTALTARWQINRYTLTVAANDNEYGAVTGGGTFDYDSQIRITATTNSGYTFEGWYEGETLLTNELEYSFHLPAENIVYTAKWTYYTVTATGNDESAGSLAEAMTEKKVTVGEEVVLSANTHTGYTFVGWYLGENKITPALEYTFSMPAENVVYTAKWCKITVQGGTGGTVTELTNKYFANDEVSITATTEEGYTFIGWFNGGTKLTSELTCTFYMPEESATYTAKWCKIIAQSGNVDAGSVTGLDNGTYRVGDSVSVTATTKNGYTFIGWFDGETKLTSDLIYRFDMPAENATYTAQWCKLTLQKSEFGGSISSLNGKYVAGETVTVTATGNLGYDFLGWYNGDEKLFEGEAYTFQMPTQNATYTAKWALKSEMQDFEFTSTPTALKITGVKDQTVEEIVVPDYVTEIGAGAFSNCAALASITVPFVGGSKKSAEDTEQFPLGYIFGTNSYSGSTPVTQQFYGSEASLITSETYYLPQTLKNVSVTGGNLLAGAFYGCEMLTQVNLGGGTSAIGEDAFFGCSSLTELLLPGGFTAIGGGAFANCEQLAKIEIPYSVREIGVDAFTGCVALAEIRFAGDLAGWCKIEGLEYLMNGALEKTLFVNGVQVTGDFVIPEEVTSIGDYAFFGCGALTGVTIGNGVTTIGNDAFANCGNVTSLTLGAAVTSIGESAFEGCGKLAGIAIPQSVTSIGTNAFSGCNAIARIEVESGNTAYQGEGNCLIETASKTLILGCDDSTIPRGANVTMIGAGAFSGREGIINITIPSNIEGIGAHAFEACANLKTVTFENGLTRIGDNAFTSCAAITNIEIPNTVLEIGAFAFEGCSGLKGIVLGNRLTSIGAAAFRDCNNAELTEIVLPATVTAIGEGAFSGCAGLTKMEIPSGVTAIERNTFYNCAGLTEIKLPASVTAIGENAFSGCSSLTEIVIPGTVAAIGEGAFSGCTQLTIHCEAAEKPSGWADHWNIDNCTVTWNYTEGGTQEPGGTEP